MVKPAKKLYVSVSRCRRRIKRRWNGLVSKEAPVVLATFIQYLYSKIISDAVSYIPIRTVVSRITGTHIQSALTKNSWLSKNKLVQGRVLGTARVALVLNDGLHQDVESSVE